MINSSKSNLALFVLLACLWSGSFIAIKVVVTYWPPLFSAALRVAIALIFLMLLTVVMRKDTQLSFNLKWRVWLVGLFSQAFPFAFLFWGERLISPGLAGILNGTTSIWAFLLSLVFLPSQQVYSLPRIIGLLLGMLGVVFIFWPLLVVGKNISTVMGAAAVLMVAVCYAIGALLNQYFLSAKHKIDFFANVYHQHWASVVFLGLFSLLFEKWPAFNTLFIHMVPWTANLYLGIFSTAIAWVIYYHLIREWDALRASTVLYVVPALTLVWDYLFYRTTPHLNEIIGVIAILSGVILLQLSSFRIRAISRPAKQ